MGADTRRRPWTMLLIRSLFVGALSGLLGGAIIFFVFGYIGFSGAPLSTRIENGWDAAIDPGLRKGLGAGIALAIGLGATVLLWRRMSEVFETSRVRLTLSGLAFIGVVMSNLEWLRSPLGWDPAGLITVGGMALLVAGVVWWVAPWVLHEGRSESQPERQAPARNRGLRHG